MKVQWQVSRCPEELLQRNYLSWDRLGLGAMLLDCRRCRMGKTSGKLAGTGAHSYSVGNT